MFDLLWVHFSAWSEIRIWDELYTWVTSCPCIIYWKNYCSLLNSFSNLKKKSQLNRNPCILFWTLNSVPFIYTPLLMPIPFDCYSFVVNFEIQKCEFLHFYSFSRLFLLVYISCNFTWTLWTICQFLQWNHAGFWYVL